MADFHHLEAAARRVIHQLQQLPEFRQVRILIIGGLALWQYLPDHRRTDDVDFLVDLGNGFGSRMRELPSGAPELLKRRLSLVQQNRFWQSAPCFLVDMSDHDPQHPEVQIDFTPREISPYVPEDAPTIAETMQTADLPYISALDLLVFKIHCCGMRPYRAKRQTDAEDAVALVQYLQSTGPILLSDKQKQFVAEGLDGLLEWNFRSREWWTGNVGLA